MDTKKKESKNLERYKTLFFQSGLVISLFITLAAFEWKSFDSTTNVNNNQSLRQEVDELPPIIIDQKEKIKPIQPTTIFEIKSNETAVVDTFVYVDDPLVNQPIVYFKPKKDIDEPVIKEDPPVTVAPVMPEFPGGEEALYKYLGSNIKYPETAKQINLQGTVYVTFVIEKGGNVTNSGILRGIGGGCDEEAVRVVRNMPNWTPGKNSLGRPVRVQLNLPVRFILKG